MRIKDCFFEDIQLLAKLNQMLIEDERAETKLSLPQLESRMADFIKSEYKAFLIYENEEIIGYALCNMQKEPIYLRQFFVCRDKRRKGYGRQAFQTLLDHLNTKEIDIDVYVWNESGIAFWESIGFEKRYYSMRYKKYS